MGWVGLTIPHTFLQAIHRHDRRSCGVTFPSVHGCNGPVQLVPSSPAPSRPSRPVRSRPASPVHSGPVPLLPSIPDQSGPSCTVRCRPQSRPVRSRPARPVQRKVNVVVILVAKHLDDTGNVLHFLRDDQQCLVICNNRSHSFFKANVSLCTAAVH